MSINPSFATEGTYTPDNLIVSGPLVTDSVVIASGQNLRRGALLGKVTATGKYVLSVADADDGSEAPTAILAQDVDASAGDKTATVYLAGQFNVRAITFGDGHTAASVKDALRDLNIHLRDTVKA